MYMYHVNVYMYMYMYGMVQSVAVCVYLGTLCTMSTHTSWDE